MVTEYYNLIWQEPILVNYLKNYVKHNKKTLFSCGVDFEENFLAYLR